MYSLYILLLSLLPFISSQDRMITPKLNPGCSSCYSNNTTLVYVRADGSSDTIHQIWDFTRGIPTIIFTVASINSTLTIGWERNVPRYFNMSERPKYSFAVVFDKIYEYDDLEDMGQIDQKTPQKSYSLQHLTWNLVDSILTDREAMVKLSTKLERSNRRDSQRDLIGIQLDMLPFKDYAMDLPHLIHTANSTLVDLSLVNLTTSQEFNASRFAWHAVLISTDSVMDSMHSAMRKSLDDEHTPGVFEIIELKTPETYLHGDGGFIQFRPIGYTEPERGVTTCTIAHISGFSSADIPRRSTAERFYRDYDPSNLLVQDIFFSFGEPGDGFYKQHNYTAWSFTVGYGAPPVEGFSLFVIMVISIGLGVPVVLALSGITYVLTRRWKQRNTPRRFSNDE